MNSTNFEQFHEFKWNSKELVSLELEDSKFYREQPIQTKGLIH